MQLSISYLRHREAKIPGITISPKPSILFISTPAAFRQGNSSLMGMSRFLATLTITSVPYTQKMSQKKRSHSSRKPTLKSDRWMFRSAKIENKMPNKLLRVHCLVTQQKPTGMAQITLQMMLAGDILKSSKSKYCLRKEQGFTCFKTFLSETGKARASSSRFEVEITVLMQNCRVINKLTRSLFTYLQTTQNPKRKQEAIIGNFSAYLLPIFSDVSFSLLERIIAPPSSLLSLPDRTAPMNTQAVLLISS